jgi:hypothetical protein
MLGNKKADNAEFLINEAAKLKYESGHAKSKNVLQLERSYINKKMYDAKKITDDIKQAVDKWKKALVSNTIIVTKSGVMAKVEDLFVLMMKVRDLEAKDKRDARIAELNELLRKKKEKDIRELEAY